MTNRAIIGVRRAPRAPPFANPNATHERSLSMDYRKAYEGWMQSLSGDDAALSELAAIAGDEKEIEDRFYQDLSFGTAGMRGVLGMGTNRMNVYTVRRATQGLADYLNAHGKNPSAVIII